MCKVFVGATPESIIENQHTNELFRSVEELVSVHKCKTSEVGFRALLTEGRQELSFKRARAEGRGVAASALVFPSV